MASAAILAGGRATRFDGRDKSAIVVHGRTILARQVAELEKLTDDILLVGSRVDLTLFPGVRMIADRVVDAGPLGGLDAALRAARDDALILLACDMPFPAGELLAHMLKLAAGADIVVPRTERGYHPLCAVYTRACLPALARRLEQALEQALERALERRVDRGELRMTGLFDDVRVRVVEKRELERFGDTARLLANVNTPAEFDELESLLGHNLKS